MSRATSPSFAIGGVSWLDGDASIVPPTGWRCFQCGEHFWHFGAALRHFGKPKLKRDPLCVIQARAALAWGKKNG
jgi:hypothetical protein